jgi:iron complex outermembrane recepter protein
MHRCSKIGAVSTVALSLAASAAPAQQFLPVIDIGATTRQERENMAHGKPSPAARTAQTPSPAAPHMTREDAADPNKETGYARQNAFAATKTNTPLIDTPMAVQVVPHEIIEDKQILNTMEAVQNVSGVQISSSYYDQYRIRGFDSGYGLTYRNGLKIEGTAGAVDAAFTERVEVIKGPASMLYGRIEPGGFVNIATKRPQEEFKASLSSQFGSYGLSRSVFDVTGPVDKEKTVLYRFIGVYDHADSFTNFDHRDNGAVALYLTFRPSEQFEFNVDFEHYEKKQAQPDGSGTVPVWVQADGNGRAVRLPGLTDKPYALPRWFSISDPAMFNDFPYVVHRTLYGYNWSYKFADGWKIANRFHYIDIQENQTGLGNFGGFDGVNLTRTFVHNPLTRSILSTNLDLTGDFATGPLNHKTLVGVDWYKYQDDWVGDYGFALPIDPINVFVPGPNGYFTGLLHNLADSARGNVLWRSRWQNVGVYAQDQISFWNDRIHVLLGGRWDKAEESYPQVYGGTFAPCFPVCTGYPLRRFSDDPTLSPRAGLLFKVDESTSVYGSYVRSSGVNNTSLAADGRVLPPEKGLQWEIGAKKLWLDGKVITSLAFFDLTKKNVSQADPFGLGFSVPVGTVSSRGVELDVSGQVTENLNLIGSYTFNAVIINNPNGQNNSGNHFQGASPHVGNIWAKWDFAPHQSEGFEIGGGVYAMADRWGDNANSWRLPGYVRFDAMVAYRTMFFGHKLTARLNVKNLTDTAYFERGDGFSFANYGQPRAFLGEIKLDW